MAEITPHLADRGNQRGSSRFLRSGLRGRRPPQSACPGLPTPLHAGCVAGCSTAVEAGWPGRGGGGARGGQHRGQLPPQCAAAVSQRLLNPFWAGTQQAARSRREVLPDRGREPSSVNSSPPKAQGTGGHPPQCTAAVLDPLSQGGSKADEIGGHGVPGRRKGKVTGKRESAAGPCTWHWTELPTLKQPYLSL